MIRDLGIVEPGTTLYLPFHTFDSNDPTASVTLTGLATTDIEIYKDGGTTQRASDAGYALLDTDGIDFDGITGIHGLSINLADNTTAGFYAAGSQYWVVISSVTVDAATVNFILATFRIGYPSAILNTTIASLSSQTSFTLTVGPAEDDALNGCEVLIHDVASAVQKGFAIVSDYTGSTKTVTLAAGTTFTAAATDNISVMGRAPLQPTTAGRTLDVSAGGEAGIDWANVGTPGSTVSLSATTIANVSAVTSVAALGTGAITAASIATDAIDADALATDAVNEIRNAITGGAYDLDTDANGRIRVVDGTAAGEINTASGVVQAALADGVTHGGTTADFLARDISIGGDVNVVGSVVLDNAGNDIRGITPTTASKTGYALSSTGMDAVTLPANIITASSIATDAIGAAELAADAATEIATAVWALATRTLTAATNISGPIADQVWLETLADHSGTAGSTAEALNAAGAAGDPWTTALPGAYGAGSAGKIIGDNINATISSRASQTSVDTIDGIVDNILVDTAEIGAAGAGLTAADDAVIAAIAALNNLSAAAVTAAVWAADVNANDNTVGSFGDFFGQTYTAATVDIQTQIAALNDISATDVWAAATRTLTDKAGFTISGTITTLDALDTAQDTQHSTTQGLVTTVDTVVDAIKVITDALGATAAARLALSAAQIIPGTVDSTAHTPTTTEFEADDITEATADHYNGRVIIFTSGALSGQATTISDYSLASGRGHFTVVALTEAPTNNGTFIIV